MVNKLKHMKYNVTIIFVFIYNIIFAQVEISKNSNLMAVSENEDYLIYFKSNNGEPDDYIEGGIYLYNTKLSNTKKLDSETYILDFVTAKFSDDSNFYFSSGDEIQKVNFLTKKKEKVFSVTKKKWIKSFDLSEDNNCLIIIIEEDSDNKNTQEVILLDLDKNKSLSKVYKEDSPSVDLESVIGNNGDVYLKNGKKELICLYLSKKKKNHIIDNEVKTILKINNNKLYYLKEDAIWSYDLLNNEKVEIIQSENLKITFFNTYEDKIFMCLNDNIFIYNKKKKSFNNIEQLGKRNFVFFGKKITLFEENKILAMLLNSNAK